MSHHYGDAVSGGPAHGVGYSLLINIKFSLPCIATYSYNLQFKIARFATPKNSKSL